VHFWHWEILDNAKWLIASENAFGSRQSALHAAKRAVAKLAITWWSAAFFLLADVLL
jgi:hypothetical protein